MWLKDKATCNLFIVFSCIMFVLLQMVQSCSAVTFLNVIFFQSNSKLWILHYDCTTSGCILEQLLFHVRNMVVFKPQHIQSCRDYGYSRVMHKCKGGKYFFSLPFACFALSFEAHLAAAYRKGRGSTPNV